MSSDCQFDPVLERQLEAGGPISICTGMAKYIVGCMSDVEKRRLRFPLSDLDVAASTAPLVHLL